MASPTRATPSSPPNAAHAEWADVRRRTCASRDATSGDLANPPPNDAILSHCLLPRRPRGLDSLTASQPPLWPVPAACIRVGPCMMTVTADAVLEKFPFLDARNACHRRTPVLLHAAHFRRREHHNSLDSQGLIVDRTHRCACPLPALPGAEHPDANCGVMAGAAIPPGNGPSACVCQAGC